VAGGERQRNRGRWRGGEGGEGGKGGRFVWGAEISRREGVIRGRVLKAHSVLTRPIIPAKQP
jgi:hypothetical protein